MASDKRDATHEGWSNKPTWAVALWLNNDQELQEESHRIATGIASESTREDRLRDYVEGIVYGDQASASLASDLLIWALAHVNYREIVETFASEY